MTRGKTIKFKLNEKFLFGNPRCIRCGKVLKKGEVLICTECKLKMRRRFYSFL